MYNKYYFKNDTKLSNYFLCNVEIDGLIYSSSEAAYHAQKFLDEDIKILMTKLTPDESKHVSRELSRFIRTDWEKVKYNVMKKIVFQKFIQNPNCLKELLDIKNMELVEDTTGWHDNVWGECTCEECKLIEHQNLLGKILIEVREELR